MKDFTSLLNELDNNILSIENYFDISAKIREFTKDSKEIPDNIKIEQMIFDFVENYSWDKKQEEFFNW